MNRLDELRLDKGKNGIIDITVDNNNHIQVRVSVCNPNGVGVHSVWIDMPDDTKIGINQIAPSGGCACMCGECF